MINRLESSDILNRAKGCLVGLAIGDAVGTTLEFKPRDTYDHITDMSGGGPFNLKAGQWTDDTSMALCLADSLLDKGRADPLNIIQRFCRWYNDGENSSTGNCFDIGIATSQALLKFEIEGEPIAGSTHCRSAGNGSIMRLAPVPIFFWRNVDAARRAAREQSETTHGAIECLDACEYLALILAEAISEGDIDDALRKRELSLSPKIARIAGGSFRNKDRDEIRSGGYVVDTLEAALWSVYNSNSFEEAVLLAVNLGEDSDTVGAVTGQLAGALMGMSSIPRHWLQELQWKEHIESLAVRLYEESLKQ